MELLNLFAKLVLDTSEYTQGLEEAQSEAGELASSAESASDSVDDLGSSMVDSGADASASAGSQGEFTDSVSASGQASKDSGSALENYRKILTKVKSAAAAVAAVKLAKWFWDTTAAVAEYGDHIDKASQKMGLSAKTYQEWAFIADHSGTSIDSLKTSMRTLATQAQGNGEAFRQLGMSMEEVSKMSQEELFEATVKALQGVEDSTQRTYLAGKLLGRGASELGALFNGTSGDIDNMKSRIEELGGVMSDKAVKDSAAYKDAMTDLQTAAQGFKNRIGEVFMEFNTGIITAAANAIGAINRVIDAVTYDSYEEELAALTGRLDAARASQDAMIASGTNSGIMWDTVCQNIENYEARIEVLTGKIQANQEATENNTEAHKQMLEELGAAYNETFESVSQSLDGWFGAFDDATVEITTSFETMKNNVESQLTFWNNYSDSLQTLSEAGFDGLVEAIQGMGPAGAEYAQVLAGMTTAGEEGTSQLQELQDKMGEVDEARKQAAETVTDIMFSDNSEATLADIKAVAEAMAALDGTTSTVYINTVETGSGRSHAGGLDYVPYHNYHAILHEGERVLTKQENQRYNEGGRKSTAQPIQLTVETPVEIDGQVVARKTYRYLLNEQDNHGTSLIIA